MRVPKGSFLSGCRTRLLGRLGQNSKGQGGRAGGRRAGGRGRPGFGGRKGAREARGGRVNTSKCPVISHKRVGKIEDIPVAGFFNHHAWVAGRRMRRHPQIPQRAKP